MPVKKEVCRNFQRGFCKFGEGCKFLHVSPQQQKPTIPFGFGTTQQHQPPQSNVPFGFGATNQQQQQQPKNPFGFGVKDSSLSKGATSFGNKQQPQFKPFENKWTRFSPIANGGAGAPSSRQPDSQAQAASHKCTDPESCKRLIAEDFENERPLWKLTCYGHWRNVPCDIVGDVSYEELRAAAYDDAKSGLSLQSIVERERNLLNSKLNEFGTLLRNPYVGPSKSTLASHDSFPAAVSANGQNSVPSSLSSFTQGGPSLNMGFGTRPAAPPNYAFEQPNPFSNASQLSSTFGTKNFPSANAGSFSTQLPQQAFGNSFPSNVAGFGNNSVISDQNNLFSAPAVSMQNSHSSNVQLPITSNLPNSASNPVGQAATSIQLVNNTQGENVSVDVSVWLKEKWIPGEIPEEAPPDAFI